MKSTVPLIFLKLSIFSTLSVSAAMTTEDYANLISDVFNEFKSSSLRIVHFADYRSKFMQSLWPSKR